MHTMHNSDISLNIQDCKSMLELIDICRCNSEPLALAESLITGISDLFSTDHINFFFSDKKHRELDARNLVSIGIEESYHRQYETCYKKWDPFVSPAQCNYSAHTVDSLFSYSDWTKLDYFNDFIRPQNLYHALVINLKSEMKLFGAIGLFRTRGEGNFTREDLWKARILARVFTMKLENIELLSNIEFGKTVSTSDRPDLRNGTLILDFRFNPVYCDVASTEMLRLAGSQEISTTLATLDEGLQIPVALLQDCITMRQVYNHTNEITDLHRKRVLRLDAINRKFRIEIAIAHIFSQGAYSPHFILSWEDISDEFNAVPVISLKEHYHLTKREMELLQCVSIGLTNDEIARKLSISRFTVQHHLQNIFGKTGVRNRTSLIRLMHQQP